MPNIREYNAGSLELRPNERGMQALGRTAGALGSIAGSQGSLAESQVGAARASAGAIASVGESLGGGIAFAGQQYVKFKTNQQISRGGAEVATINASLTDAANEVARGDPNDTSLLPKFHENVLEPTLEKFVAGFETEEGQLWARQQAASMRQHFFEKTAADQATRVGAAFVKNFGVMLNQTENMLRRDPTGLTTALGMLESSVMAGVRSNPRLSPALAARAESELLQEAKERAVKASLLGTIELNPDAGLAAIKDPKYAPYLNSDSITNLENAAEAMKRVNEASARADASQAKAAAVAAAKVAEQEIIASTILPDGSQRVTGAQYKSALKYIVDHGSNADGAGLMRYLDYVRERQDKPKTVPTDPYTYADFAGRVFLPDNDPRKLGMRDVLAALTGDRLNDSDFQYFANQVGREKKPEEKQVDKALTDYAASKKSSFTSTSELTGARDPRGDQLYAQFLVNTRELAAVMRKNGKSEQEIYAAVDVTMRDFVPSKANLAKWKIPEDLEEETGVVAPNVLPGPGLVIAPKGILPGERARSAPPPGRKESVEDILKRRGM